MNVPISDVAQIAGTFIAAAALFKGPALIGYFRGSRNGHCKDHDRLVVTLTEIKTDVKWIKGAVRHTNGDTTRTDLVAD